MSSLKGLPNLSHRLFEFADWKIKVMKSVAVTFVTFGLSRLTLTNGLETVEGVGDTDEVLSVGHSGAGVVILPHLALRGEVRGAVDQPEALIFIQQHNTWATEK